MAKPSAWPSRRERQAAASDRHADSILCKLDDINTHFLRLDGKVSTLNQKLDDLTMQVKNLSEEKHNGMLSPPGLHSLDQQAKQEAWNMCWDARLWNIESPVNATLGMLQKSFSMAANLDNPTLAWCTVTPVQTDCQPDAEVSPQKSCERAGRSDVEQKPCCLFFDIGEMDADKEADEAGETDVATETLSSAAVTPVQASEGNDEATFDEAAGKKKKRKKNKKAKAAADQSLVLDGGLPGDTVEPREATTPDKQDYCREEGLETESVTTQQIFEALGTLQRNIDNMWTPERLRTMVKAELSSTPRNP